MRTVLSALTCKPLVVEVHIGAQGLHALGAKVVNVMTACCGEELLKPGSASVKQEGELPRTRRNSLVGPPARRGVSQDDSDTLRGRVGQLVVKLPSPCNA